jgi:hypothetical protein
VRRFALLVGVNDGGPGRARLRHAVTDARSFGEVLEELGGVLPQDRLMLMEGGRAELENALPAWKPGGAARLRGLGRLREPARALRCIAAENTARRAGVHPKLCSARNPGACTF